MKLEDVPLLRQSERGAFKRCNWAWYQEYVKRIRPIAEIKGAADFGTMVHVALAEYYRPGGIESRGPHPTETFTKLAIDMVMHVKTIEYTNDEEVAKWENFSELGENLLDAYMDHYQGDPHWFVLDAERRFDVVVPDIRYKPLISEKGKRGFRPAVVLVGTFDLCIRDLNDDDIKMVDHKTCQSIQTSHLTLDEQASTYIAVGTNALRHQGLIGANEAIKGMEYNFLRKGKVDDRPVNEKGERLNLDGTVSKKQGSPLFGRHWVPRTPKERQRQIVRISEEARVMDMVRTGQLPLLKTPRHDCNFCKFYDLCELDESGGDTEYFEETTMKSIDPYADHREGADNSKKATNA